MSGDRLATVIKVRKDDRKKGRIMGIQSSLLKLKNHENETILKKRLRGYHGSLFIEDKTNFWYNSPLLFIFPVKTVQGRKDHFVACPLPTVNIPLAELGTIFEKMTTIAIVGLSPESSKDSYRVASYLQAQGYRIVPIYPKEDTILGEVVYRSLGDIPFDIDSVVIFRKPDAVMAIAQEILSRHDISIVRLS